jgi:hypothetical protein
MVPDAGRLACTPVRARIQIVSYWKKRMQKFSQTGDIGSAGLLPPLAARKLEGMLLIRRPKGQGIQSGSREALRLVRAGFETHRHHGWYLVLLLPVVGKLLLKEL